MGLGKKLATLIKATLRGGLAGPQRRPDFTGDPAAQLTAAQKALAEVQAKEQAVADQLQTVQDRLQTALDSGDREEVRRQQHLANQLEAHLKTQTAQAATLSGKLAEIESHLAQPEPAKTDQPAITTTGETTTASSELVEADSPPTADAGASSDVADAADLSDRKSRLSG
jgi:chromosome segregation ATPase